MIVFIGLFFIVRLQLLPVCFLYIENVKNCVFFY